MKKLLLLLTLWFSCIGAWAADITETLTSNPGFGTSSNTTETTFTSKTGVTYTYKSTYFNSNYLMFGKSSGELSITLPINCKEIKLTTSSGTSTKSNITVYANGTAIKSNYNINATSTTFSIEIPSQYQTKGTVYKITNNTANNIQFTKFEFIENTNTEVDPNPGKDPVDPDPVDPTPGGNENDTEVTFDFINKSYGLPNNSSDYVTSVTTITENPVNLMLSGGSEWRYWSDGLRAYTSGNKVPTMTFSVPNGKITKITFTGGSANFKLDGASSNLSNKTWTGSETSVKLVYTGTSGKPVETITVEYVLAGQETATAPTAITFDPVNGSSIKTTDKITLSANGNPKANISYSIDNENGTYTTYTEPFAISEAGSHTVYVKAWNSANESNPLESSATYTVTENTTDPVDPTPGGETMVVFKADGATYTGKASTVVNMTGLNASANNICSIDITSGAVQDGLIRWYSGATLKITPSKGVIITKISWTDSYNKGGTFSCNTGTVTKTGIGNDNSGYWTGSSNSAVEVKSGGQIRAPYFEVEYELEQTPAPSLPVVKIGTSALANNGEMEVVSGTSVTVTCENATQVKYKFNDGSFETATTPWTFTVNAETKLEVYGFNGELEGEHFKYTFKIGEVDKNKPAVGATFKQVVRNESIEEGYYVIASSNKAMGVAKSASNISVSENISVDAISTGTQDFSLLTVKGNDVLIVYLENKDGKLGIRTVNYDNGFLSTQGYLANTNGNNLEVIKDFTPAYISWNQTGNNVKIAFSEEAGNYKVALGGTNGTYFNYQTGGTVIQLYKYTTAKNFVAEFDDLTLTVGDEYEINPKNAEYPEISYRVKSGKTFITVDGNNVVANRADNGAIVASWDETTEWFGGQTEIAVVVKNVLTEPNLYFSAAEVRGKKDVGVVAQAVHYDGDGVVTYSSSVPEELAVNENTGMIRPEDIANAVIDKVYTITATASEGAYSSAKTASYTIVIEAPAVATESKSTNGSFDFTKETYGLWVTTSSTQYERDRTDENPIVTSITSLKNSDLTIEFTPDTDYRIWNNSGNFLRLTNNCPIKVVTPEGSYITKIEFNGAELTTLNVVDESLGSKNGTAASSTWTVKEGAKSNTVEFKGRASIYTLNVEFTTAKVEGASFTLSFPEDLRVVNTYVNTPTELPALTIEGDANFDFSTVYFDIDEVGDVEDENEDFYSITHEKADELSAIVYEPGVYTLRAFTLNDKKETNGMAILRLNVFPRLSVVPTDDSKLSDNPHTDRPDLTIAHPDEEGGETATIKLPTLDELNDALKYSTVSVAKVAVKLGEGEETVYEGDELAALNGAFEFNEDGYLKYTIRYADTEDFEIETTVNVILMPQIPGVGEGLSVTERVLTASKNADLYYKTSTYTDNTASIATASVDGWMQAENGTATMTRPDGLAANEYYVIDYKSVKDLKGVIDVADDDNARYLESEVNTIGIGPDGLVGFEDIVADGEGKVEFYNLQGVRMNEPLAPGLYIRRQGAEASKVYVK